MFISDNKVGPYNYNYNTEHYNRLNKELSFEKQTQQTNKTNATVKLQHITAS